MSMKSGDKLELKRGQIYFADLNGVRGSEQGGKRPVIILQNDTGNKYAPTIIVASITSIISKKKLPTHVELDAKKYGLPKDSVILLEQIRTIDKERIIGDKKISELDDEMMKKVELATMISLGMVDVIQPRRTHKTETAIA